MNAPERTENKAATTAAAEAVLAYLAAVDASPAEPVDAVIGFGVFDLTLPRFCADLFARGLARRIIFTGGIGGGTGDLGGPEAEIWRSEVRRVRPDLPEHAFILETRSTNTAENIQFTAQLLARHHPELAFGQGLRTAILVASPSRLRRVRLTLRRQAPGIQATRLLPPFTFAQEQALYARQGVNYLEHLVGEVDRLTLYAQRGWISPEPVPRDIIAAADALRRRS